MCSRKQFLQVNQRPVVLSLCVFITHTVLTGVSLFVVRFFMHILLIVESRITTSPEKFCNSSLDFSCAEKS